MAFCVFVRKVTKAKPAAKTSMAVRRPPVLMTAFLVWTYLHRVRELNAVIVLRGTMAMELLVTKTSAIVPMGLVLLDWIAQITVSRSVVSVIPAITWMMAPVLKTFVLVPTGLAPPEMHAMPMER
tara:strand:- start:567 stop:941 length:375 start_codon:yes stop_codon:yes gene_type:complete